MVRLAQSWRPQILDGQMFLVARGRAPVGPSIPKRSAFLTGLQVFNDGRPGSSSPANRDGLVALYGSYIPQPSQVGSQLPMGQLDEYNSPSTQAVAFNSNTVLQNKIVYGTVTKTAVLEAENCIFLGPSAKPSGEVAVLNFDNPGTGRAHILDCTIAPRFPNPNLNAFKGSKFKAERCHAFYCVDAFGVYTKPGSTWATDVEIVACRVEKLVYFPGNRYANHSPNYWDGSTWTAAGTVARSDSAGMIDTGHNDGNHSDGVQVHGGYGGLVWAGGQWVGDGIHVWGNAILADDAWDTTDDPSGLGIPVPGKAGSFPGSSLGWGDNPKRGLPGGGQRPGMTRPITSGFTKPQADGSFSANGVGVYIGQIVNQFEFPNSSAPNKYTVVVHDNYLSSGNNGMQEQRKAYASIAFAFYDNEFGPAWFQWNTTVGPGGNIYPIRINDGKTAGVVNIAPHPVTGAPGLGTNTWNDPMNYWARDGLPLIEGNATGLRYG